MGTVNAWERKKRETNRALTRAAQDLVHERGLNRVTIEEIAIEAGVSVRTFFNYFSCKEEAVVGVPKELLEEFDEQLAARPAEEGPLDALRAVLLAQNEQRSILHRGKIRNDLVTRYPALLPQYLAALVTLETSLSRAIANRMGVDLKADPSPRMLVAALLAALRAGLAWWEESGRPGTLVQVLDRAFEEIVSGAANSNS